MFFYTIKYFVIGMLILNIMLQVIALIKKYRKERFDALDEEGLSKRNEKS